MTLAMLVGALDMLDHALLIVDQQARIGFKNRAAAQVLEQSLSLQEADGTLAVRPRALSQQVASAIRGAGAGTPMAGVRIPRINGSQRPLGLIFTPMQLAETAGVAIWIMDPGARASANERLLKTLFGLSPAEARLALGLAGAQTVEEYARAAGVGTATVRSQLHSIFVKTGTRRQAELVGLLCRMPALKLS